MFSKHNYILPSLNEVESSLSLKTITSRGIPSEAEINKKGIRVGDISSKLLQKIEELTLYLIELKKENENLRKDLANIRERLI